MDRRVRQRRRLVSRERGRRRAGLIFLCVLAVAVVVAFLWLRSSDVFAVQEIRASTTQHVTREQIAEAVATAEGAGLLELSTGAIEGELEALPYVANAEVYRGFPHTLEIEIQEHEPVARVRDTDGKVWLVADNGRLLEREGSDAPATLPVIVSPADLEAAAGETAPPPVIAALAVAVMLQKPEVSDALPAVEEISVSARGEVVVQLEQGTELRLGIPTDLNQKMIVAADIIQEYLRDGKTLEYVDASAAGRVAVKAE